MKQKGLAPIVIIVFIVVFTVGGYLIYKLPRTVITPQTLQATPPTGSAASPASTDAGETTNWKTYTNDQLGITFKYPANGNIQNATDKASAVYLINDSSEPYYLLSLEVRDNQQNLTPRQVIDEELTKLRNSNSPGSNSLADKRQATIKNYQNGEIDGLYMRGGSDGDSVTDSIEIVVGHRQNIYKFMMHDGNGSVDEFQKQLMDQILSTFRFTN